MIAHASSRQPTSSGGQTAKTQSAQDGTDDMLLLDVLNSAAGACAEVVRKNKEKKTLREQLKAEIEEVRREREEANNAHEHEMTEKKQKLRELQGRINTLRKDFHKNNVVHMYAAELKEKETPSYILILQAKLCREVHHMCVEDAQLKLVRRLTAGLAKFANRQVMTLEQERSHLEVEVLNSMAKLEMQQKELQQEYTDKVRRQRLEVVDIQKTIVEDSRDGHDSGIDNLMDRLSILNTKLKNQTAEPEPQDELTIEDLANDKQKAKSLEQMLGSGKSNTSSWASFNNSWSSSDGKDDGSKGDKQPQRRGSMFSKSIWQSQKAELKWS